MLTNGYNSMAGRHEYRNKVIDLFIESLARLNCKPRKSGSRMIVVAFAIILTVANSYTSTL